MKLENEICRKVYDHHTVLKSEIATALLDVCTRSGISRDVIVKIISNVDANVDVSSNKMVTDYQKVFASAK